MIKKYLDYPMRVYQDRNGDLTDWVVEFPDLPGCCGVGDSIEEALREAEINKELWLDATEKIGEIAPNPRTTYSSQYSGKFNLRLPKSLHRDLALLSDEEGVSLNTFCTSLLANGVGNGFSKPIYTNAVRKKA